MTSACSVTPLEIAIDLNPEAVSRALDMPFGELGEPRVSLVVCFALTRHIANIVGAVGRAISVRAPRRLRLVSSKWPGARSEAIDAAAIVVQPAIQLVRLQARLVKAIAPGLAASEAIQQARRSEHLEMEDETAAEISDFLESGAVPCFLPDVRISAFLPVWTEIRGFSLYSLGRAGTPTALLATWDLESMMGREQTIVSTIDRAERTLGDCVVERARRLAGIRRFDGFAPLRDGVCR